jgi:hypothetical protein
VRKRPSIAVCAQLLEYGLGLMSKPVKFEHYRYVGDKRNQRFFDLDLYDSNPAVKTAVDELMEAETYLAISPQTIAEARNRGYKPDKSIKIEDD